MKKRTKKKIKRFFAPYKTLFKVPEDFFYLVFPVALFYLELLFTLSTVGIHSPLSVVYMLLFSCVTGAIFLFLTTIVKVPVVNRILKAVLLFGLSFLFGVIYLSYCEYQMLYDLNTMLAGAGGIWEYMHEVKILVFNPSGIIHILLLFLPFILYLVFGLIKKLDRADGVCYRKRLCFLAGVFVAVLLLIVSILPCKDSRYVYGEGFAFGESVPRFGLLKSLQMDLTKGSMRKGSVDSFTFSEYGEVAEDKPLEVIELPLEFYVSENATAPKKYGYNKLDIDFEALAAETDNEEWKNLDYYVAAQKASKQNDYTGLFAGKNLIFISAEAMAAEAIDPRFTPTLYRMATKGIQITDYYQPAICGTTGGEYHNIFGMLAVDGGTSMKETAQNFNYYTMGTQLSCLGYSGGAFHNGQLTFYDRHLTHINLGYPDGFMAMENGLSAIVNPNAPYSDISMMQATLPMYFDKQPFNLYYMSCSGHSPYKESNSFARRNFDLVADLDYTDEIKYYFSTQIEFDRSLQATLEILEAQGILDDTVIVISADHFPYGLDDGTEGSESRLAELYGVDEIENLFVRDHNRLIIWSGCLEKEEPIVVDTPVESTDILPTLLNLFGVEFDSRLLPGRDIFSDRDPLVYFTTGDWKTELGTYAGGVFTPNEGVTIPENYVEKVKAIVRDKITYSKGLLRTNYLSHVFSEEYAIRDSFLTRWMGEGASVETETTEEQSAETETNVEETIETETTEATQEVDEETVILEGTGENEY